MEDHHFDDDEKVYEVDEDIHHDDEVVMNHHVVHDSKSDFEDGDNDDDDDGFLGDDQELDFGDEYGDEYGDDDHDHDVVEGDKNKEKLQHVQEAISNDAMDASGSDFEEEDDDDELSGGGQEMDFGDEYGDEYGDDDHHHDVVEGDNKEKQHVRESNVTDASGSDFEHGDEYGDEYGEEGAIIDLDVITGTSTADKESSKIPQKAPIIHPSSTAADPEDEAEFSDAVQDIQPTPRDIIPSEEEGPSIIEKDTASSSLQETHETLTVEPTVEDFPDSSQTPKDDDSVPEPSSVSSPIVPNNLSLAEIISAAKSTDSGTADREPSATPSLAEMLAARSQTTDTTPTKPPPPTQPQSPPPSNTRRNNIDTSNLTLAEMIALRSSSSSSSNVTGGSIQNHVQSPQTPSSRSIFDLLPSSQEANDKDSSVHSQQQEEDSSSMSLAQMIAARSKNNNSTAVVPDQSAPSPTNKRQVSEPMGEKQSVVYKNRTNMMMIRRQQQQRQQQQQQRARRKPNASNTNNRRPMPQKCPTSAAAQNARPAANSASPAKLPPPAAAFAATARSAAASKPTAPAAPTPIPCTIHQRQSANQHHANWKRFEMERRLEMRLRRQKIKEEWQGACSVLQEGIESTKMAERVIEGFVKASKQLANDFRATSEDSVFNDSGNVVRNSFSQKRLSKKRDSSTEISGIFGTSSPILAACLECYGILAEQAELLTETSSQISWEYLPKLRGVLSNLDKAVTESDLNVKRILDEFGRYETNVVYSWDAFEALLLVNPTQPKKKVELPKNITRSDVWFVHQSYCYAVLQQRSYLETLKSKMDGICNRVVTLETYRLREVRSILLDGFYKKQLELFQQLPLFENEMVKNMTDAKIDEESLEGILHNRSKTRLKFSQSHRSSILNRSSLKITDHLEPDAVPFIEDEFGNPLESSCVLLATVVELQRSGTSLSSFVSVSWKRTLAVVLDTEIVCFLELPKSQAHMGKESVEEAFRSLGSEVEFDDKTRRKRMDFVGRLTPFVSWRLSKCSVDISNIQDKIVEVTEVGRRLSSPNLFLLGKSGSDVGKEDDNDDANTTQVETKYSLRFFSAADASKWLGAFEKTKRKLNRLSSDDSISAASSIGTSDKTFGTGDGEEDDDSNDTQDGSTSSKSIGARDQKENGSLHENGSIPFDSEDGKLSNVSLTD